MTIASKQESLVLLVGDILLFLVALWVTLLVRYAEVPSESLFYDHLIPFSFLFIIWVVVYFISGLYDKHTTLFRSRLSSVILNAQGINIIFAALFFFFVPYFNIAPKTNLVLYLIISSLLVLVWRIHIFPRAGFRKKQKAVLIGYRSEVCELVEEVNGNPRYNLEFILVAEVDEGIDAEVLQREVANAISSGEASVIVADIKSRKMQGILTTLYNLSSLESPVRFIDIHKVYEDIFDRIPLSVLRESWILENISHTTSRNLYALIKRIVDVVGALLLGILTVLLFPFIYIAVKLEDGGPIFLTQNRIGQHNKPMKVYKFRSMSHNDASSTTWVGEDKNYVTKVGGFLRKTSIDEFPQFLNILRGELSLIGPRNDIWGLGKRLMEDIPYYDVRYIIKPGLSGWAQINQRYAPGNISPQSLEETRVRLAYDFFYIKNRSLLLDVIITLKTLKRLFFRGI